MLTQTDLKAINGLIKTSQTELKIEVKEEIQKSEERLKSKITESEERMKNKITESEERMKNKIAGSEDKVIGRLDKIDQELAVIGGDKDMLEEHEERIEKLEKAAGTNA